MRLTMGNGTVLEGAAAERHVKAMADEAVQKALREIGGTSGSPGEVELRETMRPGAGGGRQGAEVDPVKSLYESFRNLGMSPREAAIAAVGREGAPYEVDRLRKESDGDVEAQMGSVFRSFGLTEVGAQAAAKGRL